MIREGQPPSTPSAENVVERLRIIAARGRHPDNRQRLIDSLPPVI